ncbi:MAG: GC-type dockerin domain-anchored protein [Phycisphaerales bacterium]
MNAISNLILTALIGTASQACGEVIIHRGSIGGIWICGQDSKFVDMVQPLDMQPGDQTGSTVFILNSTIGGGWCSIEMYHASLSTTQPIGIGHVATKPAQYSMFYHGAEIGPDLNWYDYRSVGGTLNETPLYFDPDLHGRLGYVGVSFEIESRIHYGWIKLIRSGQGSAGIVAWAYESEPDTPIVVDECGCASYANFECDEKLNFFDISSYLNAFLLEDVTADVAAPFNVINFNDFSTFITEFVEGTCE